MKLFEFQGKELFRRMEIPVPASRLVRVMRPDGSATTESRDDLLRAVADATGEVVRESPGKHPSVVIKAQLDMGGRGKAGLIRVVDGTTDAATNAADEILDKGFKIPALMVEEAVTVEQELYLSVSPDPANASYVVLASAEGGVDIEDLARNRPDAIVRIPVDPFHGLQAFQTRAMTYDLGLTGASAKEFSRILEKLFALFMRYEAELVEINPLIITGESDIPVIAGDAKVIIDDNSLERLRSAGHSEFRLAREQFDSDAAYEAALEGIPYVQFDGRISLMCAGAGLTTAVFDLVNYEGGSVANYLEFGGPNYHKAQRAMELCLRNQSAVILIVTFGTIARADVMAEGVVTAIRNLQPDRPIITCIRGTNEEEADRTLRAAGLEPLYDTEEAVRRAVALAAKGSPQ